MITTSESALRLPCSPVASVKEGLEIGRKLIDTLETVNKKAKKTYRKTQGKTSVQIGVGLSAPQIGIPKRVAVVKKDGAFIVLVNPVVVGRSDNTLQVTEGCLSFPGVEVNTQRYFWVSVKTDNIGTVMFGSNGWEQFDYAGKAFQEAVIAQHEIAHLAGHLMFDFAEGKENPDPLTWFSREV